MERFKVIIAGGRGFKDFEKLCSYCDFLLQNKKNIEIISGGAWGADSLGEMYANKRSFDVKRFPANWNKFGRSAGYKRNYDMAKYADALIAFWDGKSKGTKHMITIAHENNLNVRVYRYDK